MELARIMKPLMELEYQMHRLYMWFSDCFRYDARSRTLFRTLAKEELQHRDIVQKQRDLIIDHFRDYAQVDADLDGVNQLCQVLKDIADRREKIELIKALEVAIQIEQSAVEHHYRYLIAKSNTTLVELVKMLTEADRVHVQRLTQYRDSLK